MARMPHHADTAPADGEAAPRLDWSRASIGDPRPCVLCGRPALLRHPDTGEPHHKACSEPATPAAVATKAEILPCRFCKAPASLRGPEGKPEHWTCRRKAVVR